MQLRKAAVPTQERARRYIGAAKTIAIQKPLPNSVPEKIAVYEEHLEDLFANEPQLVNGLGLLQLTHNNWLATIQNNTGEDRAREEAAYNTMADQIEDLIQDIDCANEQVIRTRRIQYRTEVTLNELYARKTRDRPLADGKQPKSVIRNGGSNSEERGQTARGVQPASQKAAVRLNTKCAFCGEKHFHDQCYRYSTVQDSHQWIRELQLCKRCLRGAIRPLIVAPGYNHISIAKATI